MAILADVTILRRVREGSLVIDPFDERCVQPNSYDVHLHPEILWFHPEEPMRPLDPDEDCSWAFAPGNFAEEGRDGIIMPGAQLLGRTYERFVFPNDLCGRIEGVSTNGRLFLKIHVTAGFFDAGFEGTATLEVVNLGPRPIVLKDRMRIGQMSFEELTEPCNHPYGDRNRYKGQVDATPARPLYSPPIEISESAYGAMEDLYNRHYNSRM